MIAVSAPRGGLVTFWDGAERRYLGATDLEDGSGVAPGPRPGSFILTSGGGEVVEVNAPSGQTRLIDTGSLDRSPWDNHLRMTTAPRQSTWLQHPFAAS
jgi:hypothetical protein